MNLAFQPSVYFYLKQMVRQGLKLPALLTTLVRQNRRPGFNFLIYHRVSGRLPLELDLPPALFQRQLEFLARSRQIISYDQALLRLRSGSAVAEDSFILTFDDGYEDFFTQVFPLLRDLELPAILFVTTAFVETGIPYPIRRHNFTDVKPVSWDMLGEMVESGLVTIGAHTHTHPILTTGSETQIFEELVKPLEIFRQRLALNVEHFAYPKAVWNQQVETLVAQHYRSAVISGERRANPLNFNPYQIPRIPIRRSDGWLFFLAKIEGLLRGEEMLYERLGQLTTS